MKELEYVDYKNAIDHLENELTNLSRVYKLSELSLEMLKNKLKEIPKPVIKEPVKYCDECGEEGHSNEEHKEK